MKITLKDGIFGRDFFFGLAILGLSSLFHEFHSNRRNSAYQNDLEVTRIIWAIICYEYLS